jgi:GNAT superfamily N-acetyltransferase
MISPASVDDAARAAALSAASFDDRLNTVSGVRYRFASARPEDRMRYWRAERDGELVGWVYGGLDAFAPVRTAGFVGIIVHPANRREGIGSALWDVASAHLDEIGVRRIVAHSRADDDTMAFLRARGFSLEATETSSAVDPRTIDQPPSPPPGIELVSMSDFVNDPEPVYAADHESALDEPGPADFSGMTYDSWRRLIWDHPDCDHELSAVALADGVVVGTTFLYSDRETGRAGNGGTGVIRAFRGKGLGLLMKQHSLAWAGAAGITRVITQNDDTNAPMLAINARLGYERFSVGHAWVLER